MSNFPSIMDDFYPDLTLDPIAKNAEAVTALHNQKFGRVPNHQKTLESLLMFFRKATFFYILSLVLVAWICTSFFNYPLPFNLPTFSWSKDGLNTISLLISTGVLVRQTRQEKYDEQRTQIILHLNLLSEQKIAKIIALLEELRTDLPNVMNRHDPEAHLMKESADPIAVLEAIQDTLE